MGRKRLAYQELVHLGILKNNKVGVTRKFYHEEIVAPTPTGKTLGVRKANDDNVVNIAPDTRFGKWVVPVSETGAVGQGNIDTVKGEPIIVNKEALANTAIGTPVEFEMIENDWFIEEYGGLVDKDGTVYWQEVPIYIKINGEIVGKLEANNSADRLAIVEKLSAGEQVVTTVSNVLSSANNYNHTRVFIGGEAVAPHFSDPREVFQEADEERIILAAVQTEKYDDSIKYYMTGIEEIDAHLAELKNLDNVTSGQISIVIRPENSPDGKSKVVMASTATLTPVVQETIIAKLKDPSGAMIADIQEIVATSKADSSAAAAEDSYLSFGEFSDGKPYMIYKSPQTGLLVRINASELIKGLLGKPARYQFVKYSTDEGKFVGGQSEEAFKELDKVGINNDFATFLENKKFNVDIELANSEGVYVSKVSGLEYASYQDYIFATGETGSIEGRYGKSAILTTDMQKVNGSLFNNIGLEFDKGNIVGATLEETIEKTETTTVAPTESVPHYSPQELDILLGNTVARDISKDQLNQDCK